MRTKDSNKSIGKKNIPTREYKSELSVSEMTNMGERIVYNAERKSCNQFSPEENSDVKFHNVDDSIDILLNNPRLDFIA